MIVILLTKTRGITCYADAPLSDWMMLSWLLLCGSVPPAKPAAKPAPKAAKSRAKPSTKSAAKPAAQVRMCIDHVQLFKV